MTGRSRRGIKFPHNNKHSNGGLSDGRRSSFSDVSEEGSPSKARSSGTLQNIQEVRLYFVASAKFVVVD
jgi:phosphatidate cytidylyltransferase